VEADLVRVRRLALRGPNAAAAALAPTKRSAPASALA
jgi:hypothetical protein